MTFAFRLVVLLPQTHCIGVSEEKVELVLHGFSGDVVVMRSHQEGLLLKDSAQPVFESKGYANEEEALAYGGALKNALRLAGVIAGSGIDVGNDRPRGLRLAPAGKAVFEEQGVRVLDDVIGLQVYEERGNEFIVSGSTSGKVTHEFAQFGDAVRSGLELGTSLSEQQSLACDLYAAAHFETSARARLLTLVSAAEVLGETRKRTAEVRELVLGFVEQTKAAMATTTDEHRRELKSLLGQLGRETNQSLKWRTVRLAQTYGGEGVYGSNDLPAKELMAEAYDVRSQLVHEGITNQSNLAGLAGAVTVLMHDVILAHVKRAYRRSSQ